ncbi:MAG: CarD family transcriptional regulator [Hespellia sp.]|nr:CarD family transcriptional regulator [Hespellia sp.]
MYQIGEYVVHKKSGVCVVSGIGKVNISFLDSKKQYYTLESVYTKSKVYTPVENQSSVLRPLITKKEIMDLLDEIPSMEAIWVKDEKRREEKYKEVMREYNCRDWIRIIRTLYFRKQERLNLGKKVTAMDEKYFAAAEERLYSEFAVVLNIPRSEIESFIGEKVKACEEQIFA